MKILEVAKQIGCDYVSVSNVDDIFTQARLQGVEEVEVDTEQMLKAVKFMLYTAGNSNNPESWEVLKKGQLSELLGVKIKLI